MNSAKLNWRADDHGIWFELLDKSRKQIHIDKWGLYDITLSCGTGSVAPILSLYNDGATEGSDKEIFLSHKHVAQLENVDIQQLGLPTAAPFRLQVRGKGQLARPGFKVEYQLLTANGRPTLGLKRQETLCTFAGRQYLILDPLYSLVSGIETFEKQNFSSIDDQMVAWGKLQRLLPSDSVVDNQLKTVSIVRADKFTLDIRDQSNFSPVLLNTVVDENGESEVLEPALPDARSVKFSEQFAGRPQVRKHYSVGSGWYVVIPPKLQKALGVVREAQDRDEAGRKAFLSNPTAYVRDKFLESDLEGDQGKEVENLFSETKDFLSNRILCLGEWQPKLCAYKLRTSSAWLPEEDILYNVLVGDTICELTKTEAKEALPKIQSALKDGLKEIEVNGKKYPVNEEFIQSLERLVPQNKSESNEKNETIKANAPILKDNIEEQDFCAEKRKTRGSPGGLPATLKTNPLYAHQQEGVLWLQTHWAQGTPGVLLADDMGLGKTLEALSFMAWVAESMEDGSYKHKPFLVVAPTGLLKNWQDEAQQHFDSPGLGRMFEAFGSGFSSFKNMTFFQRRSQFENVDWVLTTYETLRDKIQYFLPIEWGVTVFDEAQKIKNPVSRMTEMAKSLETDFTLILTGTPVENELKDLWCIMDTATPGFLGSLKSFHTTYAKPAQEDPEVAVKLQDRLLKDTKPPMMLRRMKEDHLHGLPKKNTIVQKTYMSPQQAQKYTDITRQAMMEKGEKGAILKALQHMRNCSLFASEVGGSGLTDSHVAESARLSAAVETLDRIAQKGEKALVFLESLKLQELLIPYLQKRYSMRRPPLRISGKDAGVTRKKHVDYFQQGADGEFDVMILSPKAGGVGLTLTAANHVIHLSRWWNPAVEDQCTDRIFRIGQLKPVHIYYPLAIHPEYGDLSFDVNLHNLLEQKRKLSRRVLVSTSITSDDYKKLFDRSVY